MSRSIAVILLAGLIAVLVCAACDEDKPAPPAEETGESADQPAGGTGAGETAALDGKALIEERCARCHPAAKVFDHEKVDRAHWEETVDRMIAKGAKLSDEERAAVLDFLAGE